MITKYGVISDYHEADLEEYVHALNLLKDRDVTGLILNGDTAGERNIFTARMGIEKTFDHLLAMARAYGFQIFPLPGSHEEVHFYKPVIEHHASQTDQVHDVFKDPHVQRLDHDLVFLPGSDVHMGMSGVFGYALQTENPTGYVELDLEKLGAPKPKKGKAKKEEPEENGLVQYWDHIQRYWKEKKLEGMPDKPMMRFDNMKDLFERVKAPERTILFTHVPRRFKGEQCVDYAHFGRVGHIRYVDVVRYADGTVQYSQPYKKKGENSGLIFHPKQVLDIQYGVLQSDGVVPVDMIKSARAEGQRVVRCSENVGNFELTQICEQRGINKHITGHIHEAAGNAHDAKGQKISEGMWTNQLFWNASCMDGQKMVGVKSTVGILRVDGDIVSYENVLI